MTHAGDVFENPATRETGRIITGGGDTDGRYMQSEIRVRPGGGVSVAHRHAVCTERFEVVEGELTLKLDGQVRTLGPGEQATVETGVAHRYSNASDADCVFRCEVWPAARFEEMVVTFFALAMEGRTDARGAPAAGPHRPGAWAALDLPASRRRLCRLAGAGAGAGRGGGMRRLAILVAATTPLALAAASASRRRPSAGPRRSRASVPPFPPT